MFLHSAAADVAHKRQQRQANLLGAMFDRVSLAVMLLDANGRPIFMNEPANALLDSQETLSRAPDGTIGLRQYQEGGGVLIVGVVIAIVLTFFLRETGTKAQVHPPA